MAESRMELFIETLTGTAFELSCSPSETIVSIKAKIQYSEGIPVSQQHLIWQSQELSDDLCLHDYCITDGSTLKLVLGMRGGPINTRQDSRKFKDLAEFVERRSGSSSQPFTVLVFHDGEKVHMYTLLESGECAVSPLSGTISETSSITSIRNIEELDQEIIKENEATREKIVQLQEQLKVLNINKTRRSLNDVDIGIVQSSVPTVKSSEEFHLPPIQRVGAIDSCAMSSQINAPNKIKKVSKPKKLKVQESMNHNCKNMVKIRSSEGCNNAASCSSDYRKAMGALDFIAKKISTYVLTSPDSCPQGCSGESSSSFLPRLVSAQSSKINKQSVYSSVAPSHSKFNSIKMRTSSDSLIKYDPSSAKRTHKSLPVSSSHAFSSQKFIDLDHWLRNRPKSSPEKSSSRICYAKLVSKRKHKEDRGKSKGKDVPARLGLTAVEKSNLIKFLKDCSIVSSNSSENIVGSSSPVENATQESPHSLPTVPNMLNEDISSNKLPLIKTKKKSHNRCTLCSKKTGLATSYTCRCGKNFCASHRYAETHHCTYDYKTEGRRMLQLNNPVITASKLPKI